MTISRYKTRFVTYAHSRALPDTRIRTRIRINAHARARTKTLILLMTLSLVLMLLLPGSGLFAQNGYNYGFRIGMHMADIQVEDDEFSDSYGNRFGPAIGAFVTIPLNERISVRPELWYLRKGAQASFDFSFFGEDLSFESSFLFDYNAFARQGYSFTCALVILTLTLNAGIPICVTHAIQN